MLSSFGEKDFYQQDLFQQPAFDSPLMTPDQPEAEMSAEQRAEWRRIARLNVRGDPMTVVFTKKPDLEQAGRKTLAFMAPLQRSHPFHYEELVGEDLRNNFTPLNIRKLIDQLRDAQQEEILAHQKADPTWQPPQLEEAEHNGDDDDVHGGLAARMQFDDELEDEDEGMDREGADTAEGDPHHTMAGSVSTNKFGGGSNRDQNVGTGVTYATVTLGFQLP